MSKSKAKGTKWESAIVTYLQQCGVVYAERRALNGVLDRGDVSGLIGVVIEAKAVAQAEWGKALAEAIIEGRNAKAAIAFVWAKRRGFTSPADGYVLMEGRTVVRLLTEAGYIEAPAENLDGPSRPPLEAIAGTEPLPGTSGNPDALGAAS